MKPKTKRKMKIIIISIILVLYLFSFVIVYNLKEILGIGYYFGEKNFNMNLSSGSGGVNVKLNVVQDRYQRHDYTVKITPISSDNVNIVGISYLNCLIGTQSSSKYYVHSNYTIPLNYYRFSSETILILNDNFSCQGFADIIFTVNSVNETERFYYSVGIIITLGGDWIEYVWGNLYIWILVIYFVLISVPASFLYTNVKKYRFEKWYKKDLKQRDEIFLKHLDEKQKDIAKMYDEDV